jgi:hypothetical protein
MNLVAIGIFWTILLFMWWTWDVIDYSTWAHPEFHQGQRKRVWIELAILVAVATIIVGKAFG